MVTNLVHQKTIVFHRFNPRYMKLQQVDKVENGVLTKGVEYVVYDTVDDLSKFKVVDFSLGNLQGVGALDKLQSQVMSLSSDMNFVDAFEHAVTNIAKPSVSTFDN